MKLWIDDVRPAPEGWLWAKDSQMAKNQLSLEFFARVLDQAESIEDRDPEVIEISFDHDLGGDDTTIPVVQLIEEIAAAGLKFKFKWHIHSANPVGRKNLELALQSIDRFLGKEN
jgi:hypothetical protein